MTNQYQQIIIIGAARSGTNMLRDILTGLPGFGTWPCDEINYVWRHGNVRQPTDEFEPELATPPVEKFIRRSFDWLARRYHLAYVVEKTCANSLRVNFVNRIFPDAQFIYIVRDGRDVVASAEERWRASLDLPYLLRKARFVPVSDLPYYASRYLWNRIYRLVSGERRLAFWGPRFVGMDEALQKYSLDEVCALQWQRSVEKSDEDFSRIDASRVHRLRYEDFVGQPEAELKRLENFLGVAISDPQARSLTQGVSVKSVGKWKTKLDPQTIASIEALTRATLDRHHYLV